MARTPRVFDKIIVFGERHTILAMLPKGDVRYVCTEDDAGFHIERRADALWWDGDAGAWREVEFVDHAPDATYATEGIG